MEEMEGLKVNVLFCPTLLVRNRQESDEGESILCS